MEERGCSKLDITSAYVFEFFGCFFHGCPSCYPDRLEKNCKLNGITMSDLFTQTVVDRLNWFQVQINSRRIFTASDGRRFRLLHLYYFWECEFNDLLNGENTKPPHRVSTEDAANTPFRGLDLFDDSNIDLLKIVVGSSKNYYPLQARDSFVGGRTENFKSWWSKTSKGETFRYVDVCSLYPFVNSRSLYPLGHPDVISVSNAFNFDASSDNKKQSDGNPLPGNENEFMFLGLNNITDKVLEEAHSNMLKTSNDIIETSFSGLEKFQRKVLSQIPLTEFESRILDETYFGLVKCNVLAPADLLLPVLPYKFQSKLFFPLCRACVENRNSVRNPRSLELTSNRCFHIGVAERTIWGTFVSCELKLAVEKGYRVLEVSELWTWSREKRSSQLFKDYIDKFLKYSAEASGWPTKCSCFSADDAPSCSKSDQLCVHRISYLENFEKKDEIRLEPQKIARNEGLRFIAKILLNSFWGYLGMRENMPKTKYVNKYSEVVEYFTSKTKRVTDATLVGDDLMLLQYQLIDDAADQSRKTNVILAAFTTAHARVVLYENMEKVRDPRRIIYCDTDSIMYTENSDKNQQREIETGTFLGEMTDEL